MPQGTVAFVLKVWGGQPSDKHHKNYGILKKLLPGDIILAESVGTMQAKLHTYTCFYKVVETIILVCCTLTNVCDSVISFD